MRYTPRLMDASGSEDANRAYYDAFSQRYEHQRGANAPRGYHELLDTLEAGFVERFGRGKRVLEVGCGTGLVLTRIRQFADSARGIDLSPGMLETARARGLDVVEGNATALPFDDESFDVTCAFKVLAHIPDLDLALREMRRVTRRGGVVIAELYNPSSLRGLVKRFGPAGHIAEAANEHHVFTAYHAPTEAKELAPPGCELIASRGVRVATPAALVFRIPVIKTAFWHAEHLLADSPLKRFAGFYVVAYRRVS